MFFPRCITLLVALFCGTIGYLVYADVGIFAIPINDLKWIVVAAMALFGVSALVLLILLKGVIKNSGEGYHLDHATWQGSSLYAIKIRESGPIHCCDMYLGTTLVMVVLSLSVIVVGAILLALWSNFIGFMTALLIVAIIVAAIGGLVMLHKRAAWFRRVIAYVITPFAWVRRYVNEHVSDEVGDKILKRMVITTIVGILLFFVWCIFYGAYTLTTTLMLLGYSLIAAIGVELMILSMIAFPAYCVLGKKLIQKNEKISHSVCPPIQG